MLAHRQTQKCINSGLAYTNKQSLSSSQKCVKVTEVQTHTKIHTCVESTKASVQPPNFTTLFRLPCVRDDMPRCPSPCLVCVCPDALSTFPRHLCYPLTPTPTHPFLLICLFLPRTTLLFLVTLNLSTHFIVVLSDAPKHTVRISLNTSSAAHPHTMPLARQIK